MTWPVLSAAQQPTAGVLASMLYAYVAQGAPLTKNANTTFSNSSLVVPCVSGGVYHIMGRYAYTGNATADCKVDWTVPGTSGMTRFTLGGGTTSTGAAANMETASPRSSATAAGVLTYGGVSSQTANIFEDAVITADATGNATMRFAQNTSDASDTILLASSFILWRRVA